VLVMIAWLVTGFATSAGRGTVCVGLEGECMRRGITGLFELITLACASCISY
jgi:hypothetical protein